MESDSARVIEVTLDGFDELFGIDEVLATEVLVTEVLAIEVLAIEVLATEVVIESTLVLPPPAWSQTLAVFDLETTGIDVETSRIVSAFVGVVGPGGSVLEARSWLADPGVEIPEGATAVHGISTERARAEGRPAPEVVAEIVSELRSLLSRGVPLTIYNAPYDLTLLNREARRHGIAPLVTPSPVIDPLVIDKTVDRYRRGKRTLEVTAGFYGVSLDEAHDAGADAIAAGRVAQAIARKYPAELGDDIDALHGFQEAWCTDQAERFQDYMRRERDQNFTAEIGWPER